MIQASGCTPNGKRKRQGSVFSAAMNGSFHFCTPKVCRSWVCISVCWHVAFELHFPIAPWSTETPGVDCPERGSRLIKHAPESPEGQQLQGKGRPFTSGNLPIHLTGFLFWTLVVACLRFHHESRRTTSDNMAVTLHGALMAVYRPCLCWLCRTVVTATRQILLQTSTSFCLRAFPTNGLHCTFRQTVSCRVEEKAAGFCVE